MHLPKTYKPNTTRRGGQTLLEVILATSLMAIALVPSLRLMRDAMKISRKVETQSLLTTLAVSKIEENLAISTATWDLSSDSGDFSAEGYSQIRYEVTRSDQVVDGGMPDQLMSVKVTTWSDETANLILDADEPQTTFRSKIANMANYN